MLMIACFVCFADDTDPRIHTLHDFIDGLLILLFLQSFFVTIDATIILIMIFSTRQMQDKLYRVLNGWLMNGYVVMNVAQLELRDEAVRSPPTESISL